MVTFIRWSTIIWCSMGVILMLNHHAEGGYSCVVKRMLKAGIPLSTALGYEQRALQLPLTERKLTYNDADVLAFMLQATIPHITSLQECINQESEICETYSPCQNGGQCQLSLSNTSYVCNCLRDFTGDYCQTPLPAPVDEFRQLQSKFSNFQLKFSALQQELKAEKKKTKFLASGCSLRTLGYKYQSRHSIDDGRDSGVIATMNFVKKHATTILRLSYSATIRTYGAYKASRWYFKIDGRECSAPTKIDVTMYQSGAGDTHIPAVLQGICESAGARLGQGNHTITVNVATLSGYTNSDAYSGWRSTSIMEVQEMCPQF